jgi:fucose permease
MKFPWSKTAEAEKSTSSSDSGVVGNATPAPTPTTVDTHISTENEDPEKSPIHQTDPNISQSPREQQSTENQIPGTDEKNDEITRTMSTATQSSDAGEPGEDDESKYITGAPLYLLTFGLVLSTFVVALDNTIIATAIPRITTVFNSLDDVGWYGSSYLLTTTSLQPSFGKVYTYFNVKWTYIAALVIFEVGSVLCGAAVNSEMLIVGRAVAGCGAAALFSGGMTIVAYSVPLRKRPIYIGLLSSMFGIASVVGPILGGAFTDRK